ncbi:unnamed protein product [Cylindrotheca closterium]|uniref:Uncharacterized protein n=1 Tax=Cylindrotheca closterium TaxID=2856 RepID=A0AAD2FWP5_9STRA|nr:unnamed protein product [Cylindrotheca closterium]
MKGHLNEVTKSNDDDSNNQRQREDWERRQNATKEILDTFVKRTGVSQSSAKQDNGTMNHRSPLRRRRYLWTDAFALANFVSLSHNTEKKERQPEKATAAVYQEHARNLMDAVHETLAKHRLGHKEPHKAATWLPNASNEHPTAGGLRIGKPEDERPLNIPYNSETEWDKDGQYFHYLTKWATALDMVTRGCGDTIYTKWAMELLRVAASKFVTHQYGRPQMYWKLSIDMSRPQVSSQGARDALEGYILANRLIATCEQCQICTPLLPTMFHLQGIFYSMIHIVETNDDPLELGGMLLDICQLDMLQKQMGPDVHRKALLNDMKHAVLSGLESIAQSKELKGPPNERTPFRELGLSLGLRVVEQVLLDESFSSLLSITSKLSTFEEILVFLPLAEQIETYWMDPQRQLASSWTDHLDMNEIMLASTLNPNCWLQ